MKTFLLVFFFPCLVMAQMSVNQERALHQADSLFDYGYFQLAESAYGNLNQPFPKANTPKELFYIKNRLAECHLRLGNPDQSMMELQPILEHCQKLKNLPVQEALTYHTIGLCLLAKGEPDDALDDFQKSVALIEGQKTVNKAALADVYSSIGITHWYNGNYELAEEHHQKALQMRRVIFGDISLPVASSLNDLGLDYVNNDIGTAIENYSKALSIYQKFYPENHPKIAYAYNNLAIAFRKKREYVRAMEYLRKIESIQAAIYPENHPDRAFLALNIAEVYKEEGAEKIAMTFYEKAIATYKAIYGPNHPEIANIYNELGSLSLEKRKYNDALDRIQQSLVANTPGFSSKNYYSNPKISNSYNPSTLLATLLLKANVLEVRYSYKTLKLNDLKSALVCLEASDSLINQLRQVKTNKNDKLSLGALALEVYQTGVRISLLLSENTLKPRFYNEKAFYFSEMSKSAVLAEAIAESKARHFANIPDSLLEREKKLKSDITFYEQKMAEPTEKDQLEKLRDLLFNASRKYEVFVKSLEKNFPSYYSLKYDVHLPTVKELQAQLSSNTALVSYQIADSSRRVYTFVITKEHFKVHDEPLEPQFDKMLKGYRNSILFKSEKDFVTSSASLYKQLWPFKLPRSIDQVVVIQDSKTGGVPYESFLVTKPKNQLIDYSALDYLVNRFSISYAFSAQLWFNATKKLDNTDSEPSILLCAPVKFKTMAYLPGTELEVRDIGQLFASKNYKYASFTFKDASEYRIKSDALKKFKYLHLATHGLVNSRKPELSAVFLNPDSTHKDKEDGMLYSGEIYNLDIKADLVTLSACETGLGKVSKGEGVIGLTRALFYAGANNMLVSLWTVSDSSTSELMKGFYAHLLSDSKTSYTASLSHAKRELIRNSTFSAPYYWAAFVLIGK